MNSNAESERQPLSPEQQARINKLVDDVFQDAANPPSRWRRMGNKGAKSASKLTALGISTFVLGFSLGLVWRVILAGFQVSQQLISWIFS